MYERMRYNYKKGVEKQKSRKWVALPILGLFGGLYMLANALAPTVPQIFVSADATAKKLVVSRPGLQENRLYLPKINVDVAVVSVDDDEAAALEKGAINRSPSSGNPKEGGNFVLAAHRFNMGLTPNNTRAKSPFYYLNKISEGDDIYLDYEGVRYAYKVIETRSVKPDAVEIEERTDDDRLTLYTCELAGPEAGRDVVIAEPQGVIVWTSGVPKLKAL